MDNVIFSNRMGPRTFLSIAVAFVAVGALFLAVGRGEDILLMLAIVVGLFLVTLLLTWIVVLMTARNNVAELARRPGGLSVEMIHMLGKGDRLDLPATRPEDWSWALQRYGKNKSQKTAVIKLASGGRTFKLWLSGAKIVDIDALKDLAPHIVPEMQAAGFLKA